MFGVDTTKNMVVSCFFLENIEVEEPLPHFIKR
jgi:hypothetical protein